MPSPPGPLSISLVQEPGGEWVAELANGTLRAVLRESAGFALTELDQLAGGGSFPVLSGIANDPLFYADSGDLYRFGNESEDGHLTLVKTTPTVLDFRITEQGPVRVRFRVTTQVAVAGVQTVVREYALAWNEPFLRLSTTVAAPQGYSVMVGFPLSDTADQIHHGTAYHWDTKLAVPTGATWPAPIFQPTHDFVVPISGGPFLAALYHAHLPAWAVAPDGRTLLGCLVRNCPTTWVGGPADDSAHTLSYAFRVPAGLEPPATGGPLRESVAWHTPLDVWPATGNSGTMPLAFSFATPSDPRVLVTAVKPGTVPGVSDDALIVRLYQPTNGPLDTTLELAPAPGGRSWQAELVTALEIPLAGAAAPTVQGTTIALQLERSLTTLALRIR